MASPSVSVIVPIYNVEQYVRRCVVSLAQQSFKDFEVIFVDDCSPDNSMLVLQETLERHPIPSVKIVRHQTNQGLAVSRHDGLMLATGEYIIHVDSDDYVHPEYLSKLHAAAIDSKADLVMCDYFNQGVHRKLADIEGNPLALVGQLLAGEIPNYAWNKLVRRQHIIEHNICHIPGLNYLEDKSVAFRYAYFAKKVVHIHEPLYYYNTTNPHGLTKSNRQAMIPQAMMLLRVVDDFFNEHACYEVIERGIMICRALTAGMVVMHGTSEQRKQYLSDIGHYNVALALKSHMLPLHYKLFVLSEKCHIPFVSSVMRWCYRQIKS